MHPLPVETPEGSRIFYHIAVLMFKVLQKDNHERKDFLLRKIYSDKVILWERKNRKSRKNMELLKIMSNINALLI